MTHEDSAALLDQYLDGTLDPATKTAVDAHLIACPVCRDELMALQSILADARALPRSVMPARDLWAGIEARLEGGRAVGRSGGHHETDSSPYHPPRAEPTARPSGRPTVIRYALLAAAALVLMLGGAAIYRLVQPTGSPSSSFALEQRRYSEATAALARQLSGTPGLLPEETRAVVERNLAIVDAAIQEAERALTTDPGNTALERMVLARYQQRLALLERATDAGRQKS